MRDFINKVRLLQEAEKNETPYTYLKGPHGEDMFSKGHISRNDFDQIKTFKIDSIYANQMALDQEALARKLKGKSLTIPFVVKLNNKLILIDGHHTVIAKKIKGQKSFKGRFLDLDVRPDSEWELV